MLPALPALAKAYLPAMKSALEIASVEATSAPVFTWLPWPNVMPAGFTSITCPLDDKRPRICVGSCEITRFNAIEEAEGCAKFTLALAPMLKLCQLAIIRALFC